ncbi:MAG: PDZ domain-containing protein [Acidobacteria bacterium]|nr:PDZ domain-containing protein [Acidobacteriota bacterium]
MTLLKTAALSAALFGAAGAGAGAAMAPAFGQNTTVRSIAPTAPFPMISGGGRIGITVSDVEPGSGKAAAGVIVDGVEEESPAAKAGLKKGDVVVEFDGERVRSVRQFTRLVSETPPGRQVAALVLRDGQRVSVNVATHESSVRGFDDSAWQAFDNLRDFSVTVPPIPARPARPVPTPRAPRAAPPASLPPNFESFSFFRGNQLGVSVSGLSDQLAEYFGAKNGVLVNGVTEDSAAARAGVKAGDVIVSVNGSSVENTGDISRHMQKLQPGDEFTVQVLREKKSVTLKGKVETPASRRRTARTIL